MKSLSAAGCYLSIYQAGVRHGSIRKEDLEENSKDSSCVSGHYFDPVHIIHSQSGSLTTLLTVGFGLFLAVSVFIYSEYRITRTR